MASRGGPRFVGEKSTVCRVKVSSFSRGFCVPGARGFLDFFVSEGAEAREREAVRLDVTEGDGQPMPSVTKCNRGMGDWEPWFLRAESDRAGRTELMPRFIRGMRGVRERLNICCK